mgnify:CR=1 FL=1|jgi:tape measure domain-containing protein
MVAGKGVEVGKAYVTVVPQAQGFGKYLEAITVPAAGEAGGKSSEEWGKKFNPSALASRLGAGLKTGFANIAAGIGMHAGQLMAQAMSGGFERLKSIDTASAKLRGLGMDASTSSEVMANALASVKGTAFGMGEAATTAAGAVAAGIRPGAQLEQVLKNVANAAAATDSSMGDMGAIFNKVATTNKATNESLLQVADRGLPIYQKLAEQLGVTTSDVEKMASKGQIDFQQFSDAAAAAAGTVAEEMGTTATGSMQNFGAALSRFGAAALGGVFEGIGPAFKEFTTWVDGATEKVKPFAQQLGQDLVGKGRQAIEWIKTDAIPTVGKIKDTLVGAYEWVQSNREWLEPVAVGILAIVGAWKAYATTMAVVKSVQTAFTAVQAALNVVMAANPIGIVVLALTGLVAGLVYAYKHSETFRNIVDGAFAKVKDAASAVVGWFTGTLVPAFQAVWEWLKNAFQSGAGFIRAQIDSWVGAYHTVSDAFTAAGDRISSVWETIKGAFAAAITWLDSTFSPWGRRIHAILVLPINLAQTLIGAAWDWITARFQQAADWLSGVFATAWALIETRIVTPFNNAVNLVAAGWDWIINKFNAAWTAITGWVNNQWNQLTGLLGSVIDSAKAWIETTWSGILAGFSTFWGNVTGWVNNQWNQLTGLLRWPVDQAKAWIDAALEGIRGAFSAAVDFIRNAWDGIVEAVKKPIRFVMKTVIDDGLIAGFNKIADFANSPRLDPVTPPGFAAGGYVDLPWSASNRDPYMGWTPRGPIRFEGEEFIVNREATRRNRGLLEAINSGRIRGFQGGGFLGGIGNAVGAVIDGLTELLTDPAGYFNGLLDRLLGGIKSSPILSAIVGIPRKLVSMIVDWVTSKLAELFGAGGQGMPVDGPITSPYGWRDGPFFGRELHDGIDIGAPMGTPVKSVLAGVVKQAGWAGGYGNMVTILSGAIEMFYAHMSEILTQVGAMVRAGQIIGKVGSTGASTGPHLHWGAKKDGRSVDPLSLVSRGAADGTFSHGAGVERWRGVAIQAMQMAGLPMQYLPLLLHRMEVESGGNPNAINNWDSNAAAGTPSKGLMQTIDPTFYAYAGHLASLGPYNPLANIYAAIRYTLARYGLGGIERAWGGRLGYASGTRSARRGLAWVGERGPELVRFNGGERVWSTIDSQRMAGTQFVFAPTYSDERSVRRDFEDFRHAARSLAIQGV